MVMYILCLWCAYAAVLYYEWKHMKCAEPRLSTQESRNEIVIVLVVKILFIAFQEFANQNMVNALGFLVGHIIV